MAELNFFEWTEAVNSAIRKRTIAPGRNITIEEHDDKTIIHADSDLGGGGGGNKSSFICKITASFGEGIYTVEVHPKGKDSNEGVFFSVAVLLNQQYDGPLQIGSWVIAVEGELTNV